MTISHAVPYSAQDVQFSTHFENVLAIGTTDATSFHGIGFLHLCLCTPNKNMSMCYQLLQFF